MIEPYWKPVCGWCHNFIQNQHKIERCKNPASKRVFLESGINNTDVIGSHYINVCEYHWELLLKEYNK